MRLATGVPSLNSPPGQLDTVPTHSMSLIGIYSAHSAFRMCISAWLISKALMCITTSYCFGSGVAHL